MALDYKIPIILMIDMLPENEKKKLTLSDFKKYMISAQRIKTKNFEIDHLEIEAENSRAITNVFKNILGTD